MLAEDSPHGGKLCFYDRVVAFDFESAFVQLRAHSDIDGAALRVGSNNLALEILDLTNRPISQDSKFIAVIAGCPILQLADYGAQIVHVSVFDRKWQAGEAEQRNVELAVGECYDL